MEVTFLFDGFEETAGALIRGSVSAREAQILAYHAEDQESEWEPSLWEKAVVRVVWVNPENEQYKPSESEKPGYEPYTEVML